MEWNGWLGRQCLPLALKNYDADDDPDALDDGRRREKVEETPRATTVAPAPARVVERAGWTAEEEEESKTDG